ncbi:hypothetical protein GCM10020367_36420 [Streptomyces sannanensis]|uniref:Activator of Hsp90 ATPase homologue 1/2-like C-terminal domain-containing protein n=1 Tax=Streptomyces sannanensis TaxID=285536 RepID=A0ABP6SDE1_9ACTN
MSGSISYGTSETHEGTHLLRYVVRVPHPVEQVWEAVATPEGLRGWLAAADTLEPRLGGAVTLRWLNTDDKGSHTVATGHVTAWDVERIAEYTVTVHGRIRFHLEPGGEGATVLRFTNEMHGDDDYRLDCLAGWHNHFEYLVDALDGRPADWSAWTFERWQQLRNEYEQH